MAKASALERAYSTPFSQLLQNFPVCRNFLEIAGLKQLDLSLPIATALEKLPEDFFLDNGQTPEGIIRDFCSFFDNFASISQNSELVENITIIGGRSKSGAAEISPISISRGETVSIVGPTGSGKSQLLADIECLACGDTPSRRTVLLNGVAPLDNLALNYHGKLVAQLSQNMNFVMDLTVEDFLKMHASSLMHPDPEAVLHKCFASANELAGEKFALNTRVTQLSGGQSRALMIADTAHMSDAPIVLIDEIENAGIDRQSAIKLLADRSRIVLISTHDPLLALSADRRIVISNGGIAEVIVTGASEKNCVDTIKTLDSCLMFLRNELRTGKVLAKDIIAKNLADLKGDIF